MNFLHFFEILEIILQHFEKKLEIHWIKNARNYKSIFDLALYVHIVWYLRFPKRILLRKIINQVAKIINFWLYTKICRFFKYRSTWTHSLNKNDAWFKFVLSIDPSFLFYYLSWAFFFYFFFFFFFSCFFFFFSL